MASKGRTQRSQSATAKAREPNLASFYGKLLDTAFRPGEFDFDVALIRPRVDEISLNTMLETLQWTDQGSGDEEADEAALSGTLTLRRPDPEDPESLPLARGHLVRCRVRWDGRFYELFTMRCETPEITVANGGISVELTDDLALVGRGKRRYLYRASKGRPHGWFGHDAITDAAKREGIKLGPLIKCAKRMKKIDVTGTFRDLVAKVYENEHKVTGRSYIWRMRDGRFEVVNYRRNETLYVFDEQSRDVTFTPEPRVTKPFTVLVGKARLGKGKGARLIKHTEYREEMVRRIGFIRKEKHYGRVDSMGELRDLMKRELAKQYRVNFKVSLTASGNPFLRRGDGAQVLLKSEGFVGRQSFVFCTSVSHKVDGSEFTTDAQFTMDDPFLADSTAREKAAIDKAAKRRGS